MKTSSPARKRLFTREQPSAASEPTLSVVPPMPTTESRSMDAASLNDLAKKIAARAYELWEQRGCEHGHDLDDWFKAEQEILGC